MIYVQLKNNLIKLEDIQVIRKEKKYVNIVRNLDCGYLLVFYLYGGNKVEVYYDIEKERDNAYKQIKEDLKVD